MQKWKHRLLGVAGSVLLSGGMILNPMLDAMTLRAFAMTESEWNDNRDDADEFDPGEPIKGSIFKDDDDDYYKCVLDECGRLTIKITPKMSRYSLSLYYRSDYYRSNDPIWESGKKESNGSTDTYRFDLEPGSYYLKVSGNNTTGDYEIATDFDDLDFDATEKEYNSKMEDANTINYGDKIYGMISLADDKDYYKFTLSNDQRAEFEIKSYVKKFIFRVYDKDGNEIADTGDIVIEDGSSYRKYTKEIDLKAGTYYICFTNSGETGDYTGKYSIETSGKASDYTETEFNGDFDHANTVYLGHEIRGRINDGDEYDYYKFTATADANLNVDVKSYLEKCSVRLYDADRHKLETWDMDRKSGDKYCYEGHNYALKSGTYYLIFTNRDGNYKGDYTIALSQDGQPSQPSPTPTQPSPTPTQPAPTPEQPTPTPTQPTPTPAEYDNVKMKPNIRGGYDVFVDNVYIPNYNGFASLDGSKFYVMDGKIDTSKKGVIGDWNHLDANGAPAAWYFLADGQVVDYTGLAEYDKEWFYVEKGRLDTTRAGFVDYNGGRFLVAAGQIVRSQNGLTQDPVTKVWYFLAEGQVANLVTDLVQYDGHWFYIEEGKLAENFTGKVRYNGSMFNVVNGMVQ